MNYLKLPGIALLFILFCATAQAQQKSPLNEPDLKRPRLFTTLPDKIAIDTAELKALLTGEEETGKEVNLRFKDKRVSAFSGKIISAASKYQHSIRSVVIRSKNFNGATMSLSSTTNADGTVTYRGRIISFKHGDILELQKIDNEYFLVKKGFYELVNE